MKNILLILALCLILFVGVSPNVSAQTFLDQPARLLAKQFGGSANVFTTTNPDADGTPLTLTSATGVIPQNGIIMVSLGAGFTAPVTLTVFTWQRDVVTTSKAGWRRIGPAATSYSQAADAHYTVLAFNGPPGAPYLIMSSGAVTGDVYVNGSSHPSNNNTASSGYPN